VSHGTGKLEGKVVFITGAVRHIGRAVALGMAAEGAEVAITYLTSVRQAAKTLAELRENGSDALAIRCDVRRAENVKAAVAEVAAKMGGIDVLVNNAGVFATAEFETLALADWDEMFATNVRGPFLVEQAAVPFLRRRHGRIVNISSLGGLEPWASHAHYCSSKAALIMLTKVMAKALAPQIAVNCVAPGMISTGENRDPAFVRKIAAKTPMKRAGAPADILEAVLFFATATPFITGQTLAVDGGLGL
jgi:3-oxoacyl-[acyl-carrier protein] reductase/pteridine reductase